MANQVPPHPKPVIAVFNSSEDLMLLLRKELEREGFQTVMARVPEIKDGRQDFIDFIEQHNPAVIVYDIAPPYEENWNFLRLLMDTEVVKGRHFVLTTTNKRALEELIGPVGAIEVVGKPFDLERILQTVRRAAGVGLGELKTASPG